MIIAILSVYRQIVENFQSFLGRQTNKHQVEKCSYMFVALLKTIFYSLSVATSFYLSTWSMKAPRSFYSFSFINETFITTNVNC